MENRIFGFLKGQTEPHFLTFHHSENVDTLENFFNYYQPLIKC